MPSNGTEEPGATRVGLKLAASASASASVRKWSPCLRQRLTKSVPFDRQNGRDRLSVGCHNALGLTSQLTSQDLYRAVTASSVGCDRNTCRWGPPATCRD